MDNANIMAVVGECGHKAFDFNYGGSESDVREVYCVIDNFSRRADEAKLRFYILVGGAVISERIDHVDEGFRMSDTWKLADLKAWKD